MFTILTLSVFFGEEGGTLFIFISCLELERLSFICISFAMFWDKVSPCSLGWLGTCHAGQAEVKLTERSTCFFLLWFTVCATTPCLFVFFPKKISFYYCGWTEIEIYTIEKSYAIAGTFKNYKSSREWWLGTWSWSLKPCLKTNRLFFNSIDVWFF